MSLRKRVLLVGWDAADWKVINPLMDQGKMPNVRALVEGGVMGQIATRRARLREEYGRQVRSLKAALAKRPRTSLLCLSHAAVMGDARKAAEAIDLFLGGGLDVETMAAAVNPALHRQRATAGPGVSS